jgi:hypothetical protein
VEVADPQTLDVRPSKFTNYKKFIDPYKFYSFIISAEPLTMGSITLVIFLSS